MILYKLTAVSWVIYIINAAASRGVRVNNFGRSAKALLRIVFLPVATANS
jgi:hypothetical protein